MLLKMDDSAAELIAVIFEHIEEQDKFRTSLSEYYIRTFLEAKHIEPLCNPVGLYKLLDAETVDNLTPQIERAMLRNPDTKIEGLLNFVTRKLLGLTSNLKSVRICLQRFQSFLVDFMVDFSTLYAP